MSESINLVLIINLVFWVLLTAWFYFRSNLLRLARNSFLTILLLALVSIGIKWHLESSSRMGVVLAKKVAVKSGLDQKHVTLFELHEGALVTITDQRQGWLEIQLNPNQKGWLAESSVGI